MEKVTDHIAKGVWWNLIGDVFRDISSKCSTERELINKCADIYVNYNLDSSWEKVASQLYREGETAAMEEVRSYLSPRGTQLLSLGVVCGVILPIWQLALFTAPRLWEKEEQWPGA